MTKAQSLVMVKNYSLPMLFRYYCSWASIVLFWFSFYNTVFKKEENVYGGCYSILLILVENLLSSSMI